LIVAAQPAGFADVRATNLAVVLRHMRGNAPCSRADIAAATGLNKATVSILVADLIRRRLLRETGPSSHRVGRPSTMLGLDGEPYVAVGIEVGSDQLTAIAVDLPGTRLLSWHRSFADHAASPGRAVAAIVALARRATAHLTRQGRQVLGLTVAVPALVDGDGVVRHSPSLGWHNLDLHGDLATALRKPDYPIAVDNNANLAILAEQRYGPYAGPANLAYLAGDTAISAGIVVQGHLLRGSRGFSGAIGHIQVMPDGPPCVCGRRGCLEAVAGIPALIRRALPEADSGPRRSDLAPDLQEIQRRAKANDPSTVEALAETGRWLGYGAALLTNLLNPDVIILGGRFAPLAPWLLASAEAALTARAVAPHAGGCRIVASTLGAGSAALGAAARVLDQIDAGHLPEPSSSAAHPRI
jgi:predicted NBD/HSP70 family sugar kinase